MLSIEKLLDRSVDLANDLGAFLVLTPADTSPRVTSSRNLCGVSFEHAESVRVLIATGNFTSSLGVLRMQYEALVKSVWALYSASDAHIGKLKAELNNETAASSDNLPSLADMLNQLGGKAPPQAIGPLLEFKQYSWRPLSSYVHGGIHAITRHSEGYPQQLLDQALRSSNGLLMMAGMLLVILSGDPIHSGKISSIQRRIADCCPPPNVST